MGFVEKLRKSGLNLRQNVEEEMNFKEVIRKEIVGKISQSLNIVYKGRSVGSKKKG